MMSSTKFLEKAHEIAEQNPKLFETLMEFERTKKIRTKERLNFTIDRDVASKFRKFCRERGYNMSSRIEKAIKDIISR